MRILLFGKHGQVGRALVPLLQPAGDMIAIGHEDLNVAEPASLREMLRALKPQIVVNAAAYTNVDRAEIEAEMAWKVNAEAPGIMMEELNPWKGILIHFSTDYVFDGLKNDPYAEHDIVSPLNEYGRSKLGGERRIRATGDRYLIMRTGWVYAENSRNFISSVLGWAATQPVLKIVDDQVGSPTWARMLAQQVASLLAKRTIPDFVEAKAGLYHCVGTGAVSRYDLAIKLLSLLPSHVQVQAKMILPVKSTDFPSLARRPGYSALDCTKYEEAFETKLPTWDSSLLDALKCFSL
jgi:dTDP-4-dehydrorhamnose reductase